MNSNFEKAVKVIDVLDCDFFRNGDSPSSSHAIVQALADHEPPLLMPDKFYTAYGVWFRCPDGSEECDWIRDESLSSAAKMVENMRKAGWKAEVIARHISSEIRFVTKTSEPVSKEESKK